LSILGPIQKLITIAVIADKAERQVMYLKISKPIGCNFLFMYSAK